MLLFDVRLELMA